MERILTADWSQVQTEMYCALIIAVEVSLCYCLTCYIAWARFLSVGMFLGVE
jgi:hypothetical protein